MRKANMKTVTVSENGRVVIPVEIRRRLEIAAGCQLNFRLDGNTIRADLIRRVSPTEAKDGYGMLVCKQPDKRYLADFDAALAMRNGRPT